MMLSHPVSLHQFLAAHDRFPNIFRNDDCYNNQGWIDDLPNLIRKRFHGCDVLFYQSGVDCHIDDPFVASGQFSTKQIRLREEIVFTTCREMQLPVVTNLAGGYQTPIQKVSNLHDFTALAQ